MSMLTGLLADLRNESESLDRLVAPLSAADWAKPTPATGWTVAHQIGHLLWTDRVSIVAADDPDRFRAIVADVARDPGEYVNDGARTEAARPPAELLDDWRSLRERLWDTLTGIPDGTKIPWFGPPMSATSMATARLMETWAHGLDVADALGATRAPTDRLRNVAHLGVRTRDFAYSVNGLTPPAEPFRYEITGPSGDVWTWGPDDAANVIRGPAFDFCALVVQRRNSADLDLTLTGDDAETWAGIAQAFAGPPGEGRAPTRSERH